MGAEMRKIRPAVVVNVDSIGRLPLRIVVPITDWKVAYAVYAWFVAVPASITQRFDKRLGSGRVSNKVLVKDALCSPPWSVDIR
jgi:mRNA interferase MazF